VASGLADAVIPIPRFPSEKRTLACGMAVAPEPGEPLHPAMIWFLERGPELLVCETRHASDGRAFELSTVEPAGSERVERFSTPTAMLERFVEFQRELRKGGWQVVPEERRLKPLV
jgi:hypothetical protein